MMQRSDKETIISNVKENIENAEAVYLTNIIGMTSNETVSLRKEVRDAGGKIFITRNNLYRKAAQGTSCENLLKDLAQTNALVFAYKDAAPKVAKILYDAGKKFDCVELRGGVFEGKELGGSEIENLAKLPSREQMLATLLATFNAPVSAFVRVLDAVRGKLCEESENK